MPLRTSAIFCANDLMAIGCYDALREMDLAIPKDVAVVGYDDRETARYMHPPLTTVVLPHFEMGATAVDMLIEQSARPTGRPAQIKEDFGKHLTLWGTIDIQEVLPFGTPEDVANEVKLRLRTAGVGGGLILAPAHNIQSEVPIVNILAFYETAKTSGRYPLKFD